MKGKRLLAGLLVGIMVVCFVSGAGYGEIKQWMLYEKVSYIQYELLRTSVVFMMLNPNFPVIEFIYWDPGTTAYGVTFPEEVDPKDRIFIKFRDTRGVLSNKTGIALLETFKQMLESVYSLCIDHIATDMDTDVVAVFYSKGEIPLGYFYQGEYHLWEE